MPPSINDLLLNKNSSEKMNDYYLYNGLYIKRDKRNVKKLRNHVMNSLDGRCENKLCNKKFFQKYNSEDLYFEAHHIIFLSNGGKDKIENMILLCPDCHRKAHFSKEKKSLEKRFLEYIKDRELN